MRQGLALLLLLWLTTSAVSQEARAKVRFWTDNTGKFRTRAEFVALTDGKVTLKRPGSNKTVTMPLTRLSEKDQAYIKKLLAERAEPEADESVEDDGQQGTVRRVPARREEADAEETDEAESEQDEAADADETTPEDAQQPPATAETPATGAPSPPPARRPPNNVINSVRGAVYRTETMNKLRQIALALVNYESSRQKFPTSAIYTPDGKPGLSWRVAILPMIEEDALYRQFNLNEPWDSPHNKKLIKQMPALFQSPGSDLDSGFTNYLAVKDDSSIITSGRRGVGLRDVTDGTSLTIMVVEADDNYAAVWTQPDDYDLDRQQPGYGLGGIWNGTFFAVMGDGSVKRIPASISAADLTGLFTRNGQERVSIPE